MREITTAHARAIATIALATGASIFLSSCAMAETPAQTQIVEASPSDAPTVSAVPPSTSPSPQEHGSYLTLAEFEATKEASEESTVVLFFNASWCSTCKVARENFESNINGIPADMTIVLVDFDEAQDLRAQYGVTIQHTFVHVSADGSALNTWSGSTTIDELVSQTS